MTYEEVISGLRALEAKDFADYASERLDHLTDALMELPSPERAIPELFAVMEHLPDSDLGSPGPLVHTLERMDCTAELAASIRRLPTYLSVWMVNRALNGKPERTRRDFLLDLLSQAAQHPTASEATRNEARSFIKLHSTGNG